MKGSPSQSWLQSGSSTRETNNIWYNDILYGAFHWMVHTNTVLVKHTKRWANFFLSFKQFTKFMKGLGSFWFERMLFIFNKFIWVGCRLFIYIYSKRTEGLKKSEICTLVKFYTTVQQKNYSMSIRSPDRLVREKKIGGRNLVTRPL